MSGIVAITVRMDNGGTTGGSASYDRGVESARGARMVGPTLILQR